MMQPRLPSSKVKLCHCLLLGSSLLMASATSVQAQTGVEEVVQRALETNPALQVRWHDFHAAGYATQAARGAFRPQVSVNAGYGRQRENFITGTPMNTGLAEIAMTQLLWDGGRTSAHAAEFSEIELVRYFELLDSAEETALEALRAYLDVLRHRELVRLGKENLETHREVFDQVEESARAGVARTADLEQINGRMALAEANLINEQSNLHDVSARYLRIIGDLPPQQMRDVELDAELPESVHDALMQAYRHNPIFHATLRNISAAESAIRAQRAERTPRLNLAARYGVQTRDELGFRQSHTDGRIGLELTYDLYTGGRNSANVRRAVALESSAMSVRDRACVDIRQDVQIAYNDLHQITLRLPVLNQHRLSSDRVRTAYGQQFEIGQRTLLDVLDSENEFFEASRAWVSARIDQTLAAARTLGAMGLLLETLNVHRADIPSLDELGAEPMQFDPATACPALPNGERWHDLDQRLGQLNSSYLPAEPTPAVAVPAAIEAIVSEVAMKTVAPTQSEPAFSEFAVQLGSFAIEANANRLAKQLTALGYDAVVLRPVAQSQVIWLVRVRAPDSQKAAAALQQKLRDQTGLDGLIVSRGQLGRA